MRALMFICMAIVAMASGLARAIESPAQIPMTFTNLRVLPKDIPRPDLVNTMKTFTSSLGVRCEHCHVGEGNDLSKFDFASDAKAAKTTARTMLRMVEAINKTHLVAIDVPAGPPTVTCYTCHRGAIKPLTAPGFEL